MNRADPATMKGRLDIAFTSLPLPEAAAGDSPLTRDPTRRAYAQARAESGSRNTGRLQPSTATVISDSGIPA